MPDSFTKVTTAGYGQRIGQSVVGVLVGAALFFGSFGVLFWNEGRIDFSDIAKDAEVISSEIVDATKDGMFVSVSGKIMGSEDIGDGTYLKPGQYLLVNRTTEMYAWDEDEESESHTNTGGSETTTTTYTYDKEWTDNPADSSSFEYPDGHQNPAQTQRNGEYRPETMSVGAYVLNGQTVDISGGEDLSLTAAMVNLPRGASVQGTHMYVDGADAASPMVGDERVSFTVLSEGFSGTVFGKVDGSELVRYANEEGDTLFRVFEGGHEEALVTMHGEYTVMLWIIRLLGFLMMWFGLQAVAGPLSTALDVLPFLGSTSRFIVGAASFVIALVLSAITIIISAILHSLIALVVVGVVIIGVLIYLKSKKKAAPAMPTAR
jgi:hypothetical protein